MRRRIVAAIAGREIAAITRSKALWMPMLILPTLLFVLLPGLMGFLPRIGASGFEDRPDVVKLLDQLPPWLKERFAGQPIVSAMVDLMLSQIMAPLFLVVPVLAASLVAASAFAGERERKTLEALLYAPATDLEIFAGKCAGALVPALVIDLVGLVVFCTVADVVTIGIVDHLVLPNLLLLSLAFGLAPPVAALAVVGTVFVSGRSKTAQEAAQLSALLVLPISALVAGQATGLVFLGPGAVLLVGALVAVLDVGLVVLAARRFTRPALFELLK